MHKFRLSSSISFQLDDDKLPSFSGKSYGGGAVMLDGWEHPVVFDIATLQIPAQTKMALNHSLAPKMIAGHATTRAVDGRYLQIEGVISRETPAAAEVVTAARRGFAWELSVGVDTTDSGSVRLLPEGQSETINKQTVTGPALIVEHGRLIETSFVDVGADPANRLKIAASAAERNILMDEKFKAWLTAKGMEPDKMNEDEIAEARAQYDAEPEGEEETPPATASAGRRRSTAGRRGAADLSSTIATAAREAARRKHITASAARHLEDFPEDHEYIGELSRQAIDTHMDATEFELALFRASRPGGQIGGGGRSRGPKLTNAHYACALARASMMKNREKLFGASVCEVADQHIPSPSLRSVLRAAAGANGWQGNESTELRSEQVVGEALFYARGARQAGFRAAGGTSFSTISLPGILSDYANKTIENMFMFSETSWEKICAVRSFNDFKPHRVYQMGGDFEFKEVPRTGELTHGSPRESAFTNQAKSYGRLLGVSFQDIRDDDLGAFTDAAKALARGGLLALNKLVWAEFLDDASFFSAGNGNLVTGTANVLSFNGLTEADRVWFQRKDLDGNYLGIDAKYLLVPGKLKKAAEQLINSTEVRDTTASKIAPTGNPFSNDLEVVASRYIGASETNGSDTAYYIMADPDVLAAMEVGFLDGNRAPAVKSVDTDATVLGVVFQGTWHMGVSKKDPLAAIKITGVAP